MSLLFYCYFAIATFDYLLRWLNRSKLPFRQGLLYALRRAVVISNELLIPIQCHLSSLPWGRSHLSRVGIRAASDAETLPFKSFPRLSRWSVAGGYEFCQFLFGSGLHVWKCLHIETVHRWSTLNLPSELLILSNALFELPHPFLLKETLKLKMCFFGANLKRFKKRKP